MKRPRNHVLEDLSITAVRKALPELWVVHEYRKDYGIDVQVEIFDTAGLTTGLRVYGQLKATDNSETTDILSLDREHFEYWASHSDPVLLIRFFAQSQTLKWCWMHDIEWRMKPGASSVEVSSFLDTWNQLETPKSIEQLAKLRREVLRGQYPWPTTITVKDACGGIPESLKLADSIGSRLPRPAFKAIGESSSPCHFDVLFENPRLRLSYAGLPGFVVTVDGEIDVDDVADLATLLIFLISCKYDKSADARAIARASTSALFRSASECWYPPFFDALIYSLGIEQAIAKILEKVIDKEDPVVWFNIGAAGRRASKRYGQEEQWRNQLKSWADSPPYPQMGASAAYNAANAFSNSGFSDEAVKFYALAGARDSEYLQRDYYWVELGACEFETGQFSLAASSYQKAYELSPDPSTQWRLGDALFHSGDYESALRCIDKAITDDQSIGSYPRLVKIVCHEIISIWGIRSQVIKPVSISHQKELMALSPAESAMELISKLKPFIEICAIDPLVSFNAGNLANISNQPQIAVCRYLTCAMRNRGDIEAWARSIASAFKANDASTLALLVESAYFYVGEGLVDAVLAAIKLPSDLPNETVKKIQKEIIELVRKDVQSSDQSIILRVHGRDGTTVYKGGR